MEAKRGSWELAAPHLGNAMKARRWVLGAETAESAAVCPEACVSQPVCYSLSFLLQQWLIRRLLRVKSKVRNLGAKRAGLSGFDSRQEAGSEVFLVHTALSLRLIVSRPHYHVDDHPRTPPRAVTERSRGGLHPSAYRHSEQATQGAQDPQGALKPAGEAGLS